MKKIILCAAALLFVAATILGGYYYYAGDGFQAATTPEEYRPQDMKATDEGIQMLYRGGALREEDGSINPSGLADAISQRDLYLAQHMPPDGFGDKGDAASIPAPGVPNNWLPRGPLNIAGRMKKSILLDPEFESNGIIYAAAATGGVWKSSNRGRTWDPMNNGLQNFGVASLAMDPSNSKILYAGTGEAFHAGLRGGGVFRSIDSGMTWERLNETWRHKWAYVNDLAVSPDGTRILAAIEGGEEEFGLAAHRGVMLSTNGGVTWTKKIDVLVATSVEFDPDNSLRAVASTCDIPDPAVPGDQDKCTAWYSTNGGVDWAPSSLTRSPDVFPFL